VKAALLVLLTAGAVGGCVGTIRDSTTARTAEEQLLCTTAAQRAVVSTIDSSRFAKKSVFVEMASLATQVDQGYVRDAFEQMVLEARGTLAPAPDKADLVIEVRAGALGTYELDWDIGVTDLQPNLNPHQPIDLTFGYRLREGWCRIEAFCTDAKTGEFVMGWRDAWGKAYVGIFDDIYPSAAITSIAQGKVE